MKIARERLDDSKLEQQQNQAGVGKGNERVFEQATPGILAISLRNDFVPAFVHEHESEHVRQPVTKNDRRFKCGFIEKTDNPGEREGQRKVDHQIIPPRKR